jgi:hypothetical protein
MQNLNRITFNPEVMGGKPCIRGMRVTVGAKWDWSLPAKRLMKCSPIILTWSERISWRRCHTRPGGPKNQYINLKVKF